MTDFYGRLQGTASRLMAKFKQGQVVYTVTWAKPDYAGSTLNFAGSTLNYAGGAPTGPAWNPTPGAPVSYTLDATVQGVEADYVDGSLILATDKQVTCAVFGAEPSLAGTITIDGKVCQIVRVDKVPGAGTVIAWRIFVRA